MRMSVAPVRPLTPTLSRKRERERLSALPLRPLARSREREGPAQREGEGAPAC